jgi:hypothetical protein
VQDGVNDVAATSRPHSPAIASALWSATDRLTIRDAYAATGVRRSFHFASVVCGFFVPVNLAFRSRAIDEVRPLSRAHTRSCLRKHSGELHTTLLRPSAFDRSGRPVPSHARTHTHTQSHTRTHTRTHARTHACPDPCPGVRAYTMIRYTHPHTHAQADTDTGAHARMDTHKGTGAHAHTRARAPSHTQPRQVGWAGPLLDAVLLVSALLPDWYRTRCGPAFMPSPISRCVRACGRAGGRAGGWVGWLHVACCVSCVARRALHVAC